MKRLVNGYLVNENLKTQGEFQPIGTLLGVVEYDGVYFSILKKENGDCVSRKTVIDTSVTMTKMGPDVKEKIYVSSREIPISRDMTQSINESIEQSSNLKSIYDDATVNVEYGLNQFNNCVFVARDDVLEYFMINKKKYPDIPLSYSIKMNPYEKEKIM